MRHNTQTIEFIKMQSLGNDFIVANSDILNQLSIEKIKYICHRKTGVGCDQLIGIDRHADYVHMRIWNSDGIEVDACGNATRCVAKLVMNQNGVSDLEITTKTSSLSCSLENELISVDMGKPKLHWDQIPLSNEMNTQNIQFDEMKDIPGICVNMGNPHIVFFVKDLSLISMDSIGPKIENHTIFPEKVNVNFAQIINDSKIKLQVWERGVGLTDACGTGACATWVAAKLKKLVDSKKGKIIFPLGELIISWDDNESVIMTGPADYSFTGKISI